MNSITSPETVVPVMAQVVADDALKFMTSAGVVRSRARQIQPFGAVAPVAPAMVMVTVQVPVVPDAKVPDIGPPTVVELEQPDAVNLVPDE